MAKRIWVNSNNILVIAENTDITDDKRNPASNVYTEINGSIYSFYKKSVDELIETINFSDILDENGVAYSSQAIFTNLIESSTSGFLSNTTNLATNDLGRDAWGRPKTINDRSILHGMFTFSVPVEIWREKYNGVKRDFTSATSLNGKLHLVSGANLNDVTILDTYRNPRYEPNRGHLYSTSIFLPNVSSLGNRKFGYATEQSGAFFSLESGLLYAVVRTTVNTVVTDDKYLIDTTGINLALGNTFDIQMQWRGVGNYKFYINLKLVKTINYLGTLTELTMFNPANPIYFECKNLGDNVVIECGCVDITSEGGGIDGKTYGSIGMSNESGQITITGYNVPIIALRSKLTINGFRNTRDTFALSLSAYSNQKSLLRVWATRDFTAIINNTQVWQDFGDGHLEYLTYDIPDVTTPMTFDTTKAQLIFGSRIDLDSTYTTTALFDGITDITLTPGEMFVFTIHRENGIAADVGATFEFAESI